MSSWLFRSLVVLYPKAWRERYSKEVGDLSAELLAVGETTRLHLALELARSALAERVRSLHRGRSMAVLSGSAALVVVVVATFLVTNGFGLGGAASPRMTPVGWVPVAYRGAQVSFPPSFETVTATPPRPGDIVPLTLDASSVASGGVCVGPRGFGTTEVCLLPMRQVPSPYASEKPAILNGVPVYLAPNGDYYVPSLGVEVTASGPLARRIVDTLTRSRLPTTGCMHAKPQGGSRRFGGPWLSRLRARPIRLGRSRWWPVATVSDA
jgi:hypothetical protein